MPTLRRPSARVAPSCLAYLGVVCRNCGDACETRAIQFLFGAGGVPRPVVDPRHCTACGECIPACPVEAIHVELGAPA